MGLFDLFKKKKEPRLDQELMAGLAAAGYGTGNSGTDQDKLPNGYGRFGFDLTNPIPVKGIVAGYAYLDRLLTSDGAKVHYDRIGSFGADVSDHPIDGYKVTAPTGIGEVTIYISPYNKKTSNHAPEGFRLTPH